ncbi:MAG: LysR substrate-binding domain-containing protein [Steroidobacteraceae bacterium]
MALKTVAETRNFSAAAKILDVSPSAVSQTIKQLEQRLGVALLTRTTRSTSLTEAGEKFLDEVAPALNQISAAIGLIGSYAKKPSGLLRLNLPRHVYPFYLEPLLASFMRQHPDITVELYFEDHQSDVVANGFDAGIRLSDILAKDVVAIKLLGPIRFVIAGSPKYFNRKGRPKLPQDLLTHDCIVPRLGARLYDRWEFQSKGKPFQVQVKSSVIMNDSMLMLDAAVAGMGLVYSSEEAIQEHVRKGRLEVVLESYADSSAGFYLYYPKSSQVLPKLRAFIEHIKTKAK